MKRRFQIYGIPILSAILTAIAGHVLAIRYKLDGKEIYSSYIVAIAVGMIIYNKQASKYIYVWDEGYLTNEEFDNLRIRENVSGKTESETIYRRSKQAFPEPLFYDTEFYNNSWQKGFNILFLAAIFIAGLYCFNNQRYFAGIVSLILVFVFIKKAWNEFQDKEAQIKICAKGIWVKTFGYKPWEVIEKIVFKKISWGLTSRLYQMHIILKGNEYGYPDLEKNIGEIQNWKQLPLKVIEAGMPEVENDL